MRSLISLFFLSLLISTPLFAENRPLTILSHDRPPFHFKDSTGNVVGICVEIADTIFREMGIEYKIIDLKWVRVWDYIEHGKGDAAFTTSRKEPREPYLYYPETDMWRSEFVFFVLEKNKDIAPNGTYQEVIKSGGTVGIWRGASYNKQFWESFPYSDGSTTYNPDNISGDIHNKQLRIIADPIQAFKMVGSQRLTFCLEDRIVGLYLLNNNEMKGNVVPYKQPVFTKGYPMPFVKKSDYPNLKQIADEFERRLIEMKNDGRYEAILHRWLKK